ncbi:MAG: hypothetical protein CVV41_04315 [Candidatus Riflebacteria bacterium HGW-Riflebacteria-1]|jgi:nitroreductase|nr:MAG: hypothetical protein CVV41_04315 [Candidatus Riflebacteria bacterium HGW-Riflebacteria-1]
MRVLAKIYVVVLALAILLAISARTGRFFGYDLTGSKAGSEKSLAFAISDARLYLPEAASFLVLSDDEAEVLDKDGLRVGRVLHTQPQARHIIGYGAWLPIVIVFDRAGKIVGLVLQPHQETPDFVERITSEGFFKSWNGLSANEAVLHNVDAVSRATLTTRAVIDSVRLRLANHSALDLQRKNVDYTEVAKTAAGVLFIMLSLLACFNRLGLGKYRTWLLLASVLVPGFVLGRFVSIELIMSWVANGIPYQTHIFMVSLFVLAFGLPFFCGRTWYCTWYCPYGAAQELVGKLCSRKIDGGEQFSEAVKRLRPVLLTIVVFFLLTGFPVNLSMVEPFSAFMLNSAADLVIAIALLFLVLSLFMRRPWCSCFCPSGVIVETLRFPQVFMEKRELQPEDGKMKFVEVINLLLVIVIIIQVFSSSRMVQSQTTPVAQNASMVASSAPPAAAATPAATTENPVLHNIHQRKSVRSYTSQEVSQEQLVAMVKAGMAAPTARNRQPWQFVVLHDKAIMTSLAEKLPYAKMLASAAAAIVVCGDLEIAKAGNSEDMWMLDCSAATQNILLAAESMGLGAVWTACYPYADRMQVTSQAIGLPEHILPLCVIPLGYPTGIDKPKDKWKPERLHWNSWQAPKE